MQIQNNPTEFRTPAMVGTFFAGLVCGAIIVWALVPDGIFVTQEMALHALEDRCQPGKAWEYRTPNPDTQESLLVVECNPSS